MLEIRFHGRGGQGAVTASKILAEAAFREGKYVLSFPFFGTERRGAPVTAFTRIDDGRIYLRTQIYNPDAVVILDQSVAESGSTYSGLGKGGMVVINSGRDPSDFGQITADYRVATVDATSIALRHGLGNRANPIVNTAILGAFSSACKTVTLDSVIEATRASSPSHAEENCLAVTDAYKEVRVGWIN